jgi:ligand-binding sensor domain-containing protein/signal transduction histidine kinase
MNPFHEYPCRWALRPAALLVLCLFSGGRAFALDPTRELQQYNCQSWTRQSGLPVNGVQAITQSQDGFLWLGTAVGLLRFDGFDFKVIDLAGVPGTRSSIVTSLANANDGGLWVGLQSGSFGYFDRRSLSIRGQAKQSGLNQTVGSLMESKDGTLWLATRVEAARITRAGNYESLLTSSPELPVNILFQFADSRDRHWIATAAEGLFYWQDRKLVRFPDPAVATTLAMAEDREGNIWIGNSTGLHCYDSNLQPKEIPPLATSVRNLLVDRSGTLWIGTDGLGLGRYAHGKYSFLNKAGGLVSDYVTTVMEDSEGSLWVGTPGGLSQLRDVKFAAQNPAEDSLIDYAAAVAPSARGGAWVASRAGVTYFGGGMRKTYGAQAGLPEGSVKRVFEAANGDVYLVSGLTTLVILSGEKVAAIHPASSFVVGMVEDARSVIVSVAGSLFRAGKEGLTPYKFTAGTPVCNWILNLAPGRDGAFWVASENGIFRVKDGTFQQWSVAEGLPGTTASTIMEDTDGAVWASTPTGIVRLKDNTIRLIGRKDGLFDDNIYAVVPDDLGSFWIDSGRGIFRVSRQDLNDFADGKIRRVGSVAFDGPDSVTTADKTNSQERVGCKTLDGRIWFPSAKGIVVIDPSHIPTNRIPPAVHLDRVLANRLELDLRGPAVAPPGRGELEFHFVALSLAAPEQVKIRYQLEGFDSDWIEADNRRVAFYTNLRPGQYNFRVTAANSDGVWSPAWDSLRIELRPHFYQTVWFYSLCGGAVLAALAGAYLWRVRLIRQEQKDLQAASDRLEIQVARRTAELDRANVSLHSEIQNHQQTEAQLQQKTQTLEKEIEERKRMGLEIERVHAELVVASRQAGMAEVATGVLHNVGNALNSVNVSATLVADQVRQTKAGSVTKVAALLDQHKADLAGFLTTDPRGQMLPAYLGTLADVLAAEQKTLLTELELLCKNVDHIKDIVAMQQSFARTAAVIETVSVPDLIEDALRINAGSLARHAVDTIRDYQARPVVTTDKHKVIQILVNLVRNAMQACDESGRTDKRITIRTTSDDRSVHLAIIDNGVGIPAENFDRIFNHGFTTRKTGHGFGLHSGALAARELGGSLRVHSDGPGLGATFILDLPCKSTVPPHENALH